MKPEVIISSYKHHYYHTAKAAYQAGYLKRFITGIYFKLDDNKFYSDLIRYSRLFKFDNKLSKVFHARYEKSIDSNLIISLAIAEILGRIAGKSPVINKSSYQYWTYANLFDIFALSYIKDCDIFHGSDLYSLFCMKKAKKKGAITVLDQKIAPAGARKKLLGEEYGKYGISIPLSDYSLFQKTKKECEIADYIIVGSQFVFDCLVQQGINPEKIFIIPYGVDVLKFKPIQKNDNVFRIIQIGLSLRKGVHYLLEAYKQLNFKNSELLLIGRIGEDLKAIMPKYKGLFKHIDYIPNSDLPFYYANSSVFVLPSILEGSSLCVYEAMASGLPVIVTKNCGSVARDGKDGFVIPTGNVEALMEKLSLLYENRQLGIEMGRTGFEYVKNFTWENYGKKLIETYNKIIATKRNTKN
ncbi:MAG: glycosyltransferase family 4 protein [Chloroflexi bacterium]|nr:glycosyltransferase family 4 protein [Chloroflexota bacterium]